ncbi:type IV pilin [Halovenus halobia]|uniref:type IV pilin n=1 Tax=Halovenus halobia TaxID=3396622 RepID=UPI003F561C51
MVRLPNRAQSETIGIVLLTAVIVVVTTTAGFFILTDLNEQTEGESRADIEITANSTAVVIKHQGGDGFNANKITVIVRTGGTEQQFVLADRFRTDNGNGDRFAPGQRWEQTPPNSYSGDIEVLVVDTAGGQVLEQSTVTVTN